MLETRNRLTLLGLCLLLVACVPVGGHPTPNPKEKKMLDQLLENRKPYCFGRYVFDKPPALQPEAVIRINNILLETQRMYKPAFEQRIALREKALRETKPNNPQDAPYLKNVYKLPNGLKGVIFESNRRVDIEDRARTLDAYWYVGKTAFHYQIEVNNGTSSRYEGEAYEGYRKVAPSLFENTVPQKLAELLSLVNRTRERADDDIPREPGFCGPGLFIAGLASQTEIIEFNAAFSFPDIPGFNFGLKTDNADYSGETETLMDRTSQAIQMMARKYHEIVVPQRSGQRFLPSGLRIDEVATYGKTSFEGDYSGYDIEMELNGKGWDLKKPYLSGNLKNFPPTQQDESNSWVLTHGADPILSKAETYGLWDALMDSLCLRLRPGVL